MKKVLSIVLMLMLLSLVACGTNAENNDTNNDGPGEILYPDEILEVNFNGEQVGTITLAEIVELEEVEFEATLKSSGNDPVDQLYSGVLLKDILSHMAVDLNAVQAVIVSASDGYAVTVLSEKLMEADNVYIAFKKEGQWIENKDNNGNGPMQMIISNDPFSQYWCKFVVSIDAIE
jgi:hypothetical protein